jgi:Flp pilus assembly pilin Flp
LLDAVVRLFRKNERGQDLSEYCLLTALVALVVLGLYIYASGGVKNLWSTANTALGNGAGAAASASAGEGTHSQAH